MAIGNITSITELLLQLFDELPQAIFVRHTLL